MKNIESCTRVLHEEHHLIEKATIAIAEVIRELEKGISLDRDRVVEIAESFATFVGRCHHPKEDFLLSMIRTRCGCTGEYPVRTFYEEHHRVELLLARLSKTAKEYSSTVQGGTGPLVQCFGDVVDFYPGHMWKADHILFPLADELLSEIDQDALIQQFAWIDKAVGSGADEQLRAIVAEFHPRPKVA
jgi:hemerythrin-like domain-containing protein